MLLEPHNKPTPLLAPAIGMCAGIAAARYGLPAGWWIAVVAVGAAAGVLTLRGDRARRLGGWPLVVAALGLAGAGVGWLRYRQATTLPSDHIAHVVGPQRRLARVEGRIVSTPTVHPGVKRNPYLPYAPTARVRFVLDTTRLLGVDEQRPLRGLLDVGVDAERLDVSDGDVIEMTGWIFTPLATRNPGETDWRAWRARQGIHAQASVESASLIRPREPQPDSPRRWLARVRNVLRGSVRAGFDPGDEPASRLLDAMVLGQRSAADRAMNDIFLRTGTIHFLSVSGFHVTLLMTLAFALLHGFRRPKLAAAIAMLLVVGYALIAEPNAPILRSMLMGVLLCLAVLLGRPLCSVNWLCLAAILLLAFRPLDLFDAGFQLSFLQVWALLVLVPPIYVRLTRGAPDADVPRDADTYAAFILRYAARTILGGAVTCMCCWLVATPLTIHHFGLFTPWAPLQSLIVAPLVTVVTAAGFAQALLGLVPALGALSGELLAAAAMALLRGIAFLARFPGTLIEVAPPPIGVTILSQAAVLGLLWPFSRRCERPPGDDALGTADRRPRSPRFRARLAFRGLCVVLIVAPWIARLLPPNRSSAEYSAHVLSVGHGSAALVVAPGGAAALIDAGTLHNFDVGQAVVLAARSLGVNAMPLAAVSHGDIDHFSGIAPVVNHFRTGTLAVHPRLISDAGRSAAIARFLDSLAPVAPALRSIHAGQTLSLGDARLEVLWPPPVVPEAWSENDRSLVLRVTVRGRRILFPGDAAHVALAHLTTAHREGRIDLGSDVLVAPHHGATISVVTERFYRAVAPAWVIVSAGRERADLEANVRRWLGPSCRVLNTHDSGAVAIRIGSEGRIGVSALGADE